MNRAHAESGVTEDETYLHAVLGTDGLTSLVLIGRADEVAEGAVTLIELSLKEKKQVASGSCAKMGSQQEELKVFPTVTRNASIFKREKISEGERPEGVEVRSRKRGKGTMTATNLGAAHDVATKGKKQRGIGC